MAMSSLSRLKRYFDLSPYQANHQAADLPEIPVHYFRPPLFSAPYRNALKLAHFSLILRLRSQKCGRFLVHFFDFRQSAPVD